MDCIKYARILFNANPDITAEEMLHNLHCANFSFSDCITAVRVFFSSTADTLCQLAVNEFKHPRVEKDTLRSAFISLGYSDTETDAAIAAHYPSDINRYALCLSSDSVATAPNSASYNLGTGDFTVEAWIKPAVGGGTILSRKPTEGCYGNGGFLIVLKSTGVIKLATAFMKSIPMPYQTSLTAITIMCWGCERTVRLKYTLTFKRFSPRRARIVFQN